MADFELSEECFARFSGELGKSPFMDHFYLLVLPMYARFGWLANDAPNFDSIYDTKLTSL